MMQRAEQKFYMHRGGEKSLLFWLGEMSANVALISKCKIRVVG